MCIGCIVCAVCSWISVFKDTNLQSTIFYNLINYLLNNIFIFFNHVPFIWVISFNRLNRTRFFLEVLWRLPGWPRFKPPLPVFKKRFETALRVFRLRAVPILRFCVCVNKFGNEWRIPRSCLFPFAVFGNAKPERKLRVLVWKQACPDGFIMVKLLAQTIAFA